MQNNNDSTNQVHNDMKKKRKKNNLIDIDPKMDYFAAVGMIHQHIMGLEI